MQKPLHRVDDHIKRKGRKPEHLKVGDSLALERPAQQRKASRSPLTNIVYDCQYFINKRYSRQHTPPAGSSVTANTLTHNHTDNGLGANSSYTAKVWTDGTQGWVADEWIDHYLKVDGLYYLIMDNDGTTVTIRLNNQPDPSDSENYDIVPFIPNQLVDAWLVPDNSVQARRLLILSNTETAIVVETNVIATGTVTTASVGAFDNFSDSAFAGTADDDAYLYYTAEWTSATNPANVGEEEEIDNYTDAGGDFETAVAFPAAIVIGDTFNINDNLLWVATAHPFDTFEIQGYVILEGSDFLDTNLVAVGEVFAKEVVTSLGELNEHTLPAFYNAIYSIKMTAREDVTVVLDLDCRDSIRITSRDLSQDTLSVAVDSGLGPNQSVEAQFGFSANAEYRIDVAFYAESGGYGFRLGTNSQPFGFFISSWDSALPDAPDWDTITGGNDAPNPDPDAESREIILRFTPAENLFGDNVESS